ncbi:hypothetical protein [Sanguibacter inulinus]|uniref:Uncharacterized protein n=1 Tax=Sanguibacter inulinus TaxID=60922 RepID=A0A853EYH5_9MICO|nr:hypothetical protein [Sanguibacter inulinus]MBF0723759.1 hypothetical protein [Sanguibacter inulinus]NYS94904.1 hypothetical protein [Sanguibacter inulinus]
MQLSLPLDEALALAAAKKPLPPFVRSLRCEGSTIVVEVDLRLVPDGGTALRLAAAAVGTVTATAVLTGYAGGVATFEVTAQARSIPAHKLLNHLTGPVNTALARQGLPEGLVEIRKGDGDPVVAVRVQEAVATKVTGVTLTDLAVHDGAVHVSARIEKVTLLG